MRNLFILISIVFFGLLGCETESLNVLENQNIDCENSNYYSLGLTGNDMVIIGELHNIYALKIHSQLNLKPNTNFAYVKNALVELHKSELENLEIQNQDLIDFPLLQTNFVVMEFLDIFEIIYDLGGIKEWNNCIFSSEGWIEFDRILNAIDHADDVQNMNNLIDSLVTHFFTLDLAEYELEILITSAEVARNSFELWAPYELGGMNLYDDIYFGGQRSWWKRAIRGDVEGVAVYCAALAATGAISAAAIPGANSVIAVGAGVSAVGGSIFGALR